LTVAEVVQDKHRRLDLWSSGPTRNYYCLPDLILGSGQDASMYRN